MIDLGEWAREGYAIPGKSSEVEEKNVSTSESESEAEAEAEKKEDSKS
jgi:endogenous inhibitor of DNA gyrase (YacG/DUF329 family)